MGLEFSSTSQSISFPFGAELTDVRVTSMTRNSGAPLIESPAVTIAPSILSLLMFHPGVRVRASLLDGIVKVILRPSAGGVAVSYDFDAVNIAKQQWFAFPGGEAAGTISGAGNLWVSPADIAADSGGGELTGAALIITTVVAPQPIRLGDAHSRFSLSNGTLTLDELMTSGGDVALTATGTIQLAPDFGESRLAIQFTLVPAPSAVSRLGILLAVLPHPPGPQPYILTGTINAPRLS